MHKDPKKRQLTALAMAAVMTLTSLPLGMAQAGMVSTEEIIDQQASETVQTETTDSRAKVQEFLAREDVRKQMVELGIDPAEAEARVAAMTDREVADLAGRLGELPAGGVGVGTILVFAFIAFGVAVLMDAFGMIEIFPFVCGPGECTRSAVANYPEPAAAPVEPYVYDERRPVYRDDPYDDRRRYRDYDRGYDPNQYYDQQPAPGRRNYFEERYGTQRPVR